MTEKPEYNLWRVIGIVLGTMVFLWAGSGLFLYAHPTTWAIKGQFGDMFGAINSLFSGLALVGVIAAIVLQNQELALQRKELEDNRRELARAATAQEATQKAVLKQAKLMAISAYSQGLACKISASYTMSSSTPNEMKMLNAVLEDLKKVITELDA